MALKVKGKCLRPGCLRGATVRGLCTADIQSVYLAIKNGETTMKKLEDEGKVLRSSRNGIKKWLLKPGKGGAGVAEDNSKTEE